MKAFDFFIHPELFRYTAQGQNPENRAYIHTTYRPYLESIVSEIQGSQNPILLFHEGFLDVVCSRLIPARRQVRTQKNSFDETPYGQVSQDDWNRFLELISRINQESHLRIHGSFYGQCLAEFALQLEAYITQGKNVGEVFDSIVKGNISARAKEEISRAQEKIRQGAFLKSNIRYGTVLYDDFMKKGISSESESEYLPKGCINHQLTDEETRIFRSCVNTS